MALTKVTNDLQDALAAAQPTITSVGTLTGLTVSGTATAQKLVSTNGVLELDDNGSHNGIINSPASLFLNIDSDNGATNEKFVIAKDRTGTSGGTELLKVQEDGKVAIGSTVANKIFNLADPAQGGEALKLHFEANASADKWAIYAYDRTNGHYANMSFGANSLVIDSAGRVTMPSQPAFSVYKSAAQSNLATGYTTVTLDSEVYDVGGNFASNTFTAPVTGKYMIVCNLSFTTIPLNSNWFFTMIDTSNRAYNNTTSMGQYDDGTSSTYGTTYSHTVIADMDANDTMVIKVYQYTGTTSTDIVNGSAYTYVQGILLS